MIVVSDIDGTIADVGHRRRYVATRPRNWAAWNAALADDTVHEDIKALMAILQEAGCMLVLCSGRGEETRAVTEQWLRDNGFTWQALYMRAAGDHRPDSVVKVELLNRIRRDYGEPNLWFDDRQSVVDAIRSQGVRVLQVAPGDF
jgi:HAD superfamily, subfamily IIIB (Acid phosphatase)